MLASGFDGSLIAAYKLLAAVDDPPLLILSPSKPHLKIVGGLNMQRLVERQKGKEKG